MAIPEAAPDQYGVVGHPIAHSWSPFIHGMFAKNSRQNMVYRLHDIEPADFRREVLRLMGETPGASATLLQTVGVKGYDGFAIAVVGGLRA